jgi:hypothetical protein
VEAVAYPGNPQEPPRTQGRTSRTSIKPDLAKNNFAKKELKGKPTYTIISRQMPNYANTQLYEIIEHDENGEPVVYRGHTTQPLHKRLWDHRVDFKQWKNGNKKYCSSFEVLKHGPGRIELVRVVCCFNIKEAIREEGKFIRELPTCVNIVKNKCPNRAERYEANKDAEIAKQAEYRKTHNKSIKAKRSEKVTCECGAVIRHNDMTRHRNRMTHIKALIYC